MGDLRLTTDLHGRLRSVQHGQNVPDNSLSVRQSYDRAGRLSSVTVQWSGFAGLLLDLRGSFDSAGRLVKETGYRRPGITTPISSYVRTVPAGQRC